MDKKLTKKKVFIISNDASFLIAISTILNSFVLEVEEVYIKNMEDFFLLHLSENDQNYFLLDFVSQSVSYKKLNCIPFSFFKSILFFGLTTPSFIRKLPNKNLNIFFILRAQQEKYFREEIKQKLFYSPKDKEELLIKEAGAQTAELRRILYLNFFNDREKRLITLLRSKTTIQIASEMNMSIPNIDRIKKDLFNRTGTASKAELVAFALENNLIDHEPFSEENDFFYTKNNSPLF